MAKPVEGSQFLEVVGLYPKDTGSLTTDSVYFDLKGAFVIDTMNGLKINSGAGNQVGGFTIAGTVTLTGAFTFSPDNTYDIGTSGANRPRNIYQAGGTFQSYNPGSGIANDGTNYERVEQVWSGSVLFLQTNASGTGVRRPMVINGNPVYIRANNLGAAWLFNGAGHLLAETDNAFDIGASGANRPRNLFLGGGVTHGSATLLTTTTALTNGAAAQTATLTNGPAAGNPTKWVPINDNGTTRYIPAW